MRDQNIDMFLAQETDIQTRDASFSSFLQKNEIRDVHFATSESSFKFHSYKKPGDTFCITGNNLKPHVLQKLTDHMGRWACCIYQLKGINVAFLSVYHTVDNAHHGPNSIHAQHLAILLREVREVNPQQAWQQDIIESIQVLQAQKVEVVIAGDFNTVKITRRVIKEICTQCKLEVISHSSNGFSSY
jgi:hypothetical protein